MAFIPDADQPPASMVAECSFPGCTNPVSEWGGRGRRPTKCDDHKTAKVTSIAGGRRNDEPSELARNAARVLAQGNTLFAACISIWFPLTSKALVDDALREQFIDAAAVALDSDKALCRKILRGGTESAKIGLVIAYGGIIASIAPVLFAEIAVKRAEREAENEGDGG